MSRSTLVVSFSVESRGFEIRRRNPFGGSSHGHLRRQNFHRRFGPRTHPVIAQGSLFSEIIVMVASQLGVKNVIYMSILGCTVSAVFDLLCQFGAVACIYSDEE